MRKNLNFQEFHKMSNKEMYTFVFSNYILNPSGDHKDPYIGNTQRKDYLPFLENILYSLPKFGQVLDVGGGDGSLLCNLIKKSNKECQLTYLEPDHTLFKCYQNTAKKLNISNAVGMNAPVQRLYEHPLPVPANLILASHMIYHLSEENSSLNQSIDDIVQFVSILYSQLNDNGKLVVIYTDCELSYTGRLSLNYYQNSSKYDEFKGLYRIRNQLLFQKRILKYLHEMFPQQHASMQTYCLNSKFYGDTLDVITLMGLMSDVFPYNDNPVDLSLLEFSWNYLNSNPEQIGLCKEKQPGLRQGMWKVNQPQVVCIISKNSKVN